MARKNNTVIFAIIVSTLLVILVLSTFTSIHNMVETKQQMLFGSIAEGVYLSVNFSWYEELQNSGKFEDVGAVCQMGTYLTDADWEDFDEASEHNKLLWASEKTAGWNFNELVDGSWPQEKNEIVVDENFVNSQKSEIKVGDSIHIFLRSAIKEYELEAVITGICKANREWKEARVYVSDAFFSDDRSGSSMQAYCRFQKGQYREENLISILQDEDGARTIIAAINPTAMEKMDGSTFFLAAGMILLTVVCAGLMIYVIYYISFVKNVNQYGQLKLIGVSDKKISKIVLMHAARQYGIGVPIGCVIGVLFSYIIMPKVAQMEGISGQAVITIKPVFFALAAALAFVTVCIGISKPLRTLKKIEPIHTVGFVDKQSAKIKIKKRSRFTEVRFARRNIQKRKKSFLLVEFSIGVSVLLFVCTTNLVSSISLDRLLDHINLFADIEIGTEDALSAVEIGKDFVTDALPAGFVSDIEPIADQTQVVYHYQIMLLNGFFRKDADRYCRLIQDSFSEEELTRINSRMVDEMKKHQKDGTPIWITNYYKFYDPDQMSDFPIFEGEIDREKYESGNYVLVTAFDGEGHSYYHVGDKVTIFEELPTTEGLSEAKKTGEQGLSDYFQSLPSRQYEVMAVVGNRFDELMYPNDAIHIGMITFIFPVKKIDEMWVKPDLKLVSIDTDDLQQQNDVEQYVKEIIQLSGNEGKVEYRSATEYNNALNEMRLLLSFIGNGLAVVVGLMALGNFMNNCISGIVERKEEFRTLHAIGMPRSRLLRILRYENLFTVLTAVIPAYLFGQIISKFFVLKIADRLGYLEWKRSWLPGIVLMIVLVGVSMVYPNRKSNLDEQWVRRTE